MDKAEFNKSIGIHLRETRIKHGLKQDEVAVRMDVTYQVVSDYERGKYTPTIIWIEKFCNAINLEPIVFFQEFYEKRNESTHNHRF